MVKNNIVTQLTGFKDRLMAPYKGLKVSWFDSWHPALDEALQVLPEDKTYPHELYRLIIQNSGSAKKKTALVTYGGSPVGSCWAPSKRTALLGTSNTMDYSRHCFFIET